MRQGLKITVCPHGLMTNQGMGNKYITSHGIMKGLYVRMQKKIGHVQFIKTTPIFIAQQATPITT